MKHSRKATRIVSQKAQFNSVLSINPNTCQLKEQLASLQAEDQLGSKALSSVGPAYLFRPQASTGSYDLQVTSTGMAGKEANILERDCRCFRVPKVEIPQASREFEVSF